mmetsp:Transcript_111786/g.326883  ORF Transcript_111786/g.326883 Transcript_111786/m.326883 type:complete len:223 (+) Transcript_111786:604-1272(+)
MRSGGGSPTGMPGRLMFVLGLEASLMLDLEVPRLQPAFLTRSFLCSSPCSRSSILLFLCSSWSSTSSPASASVSSAAMSLKDSANSSSFSVSMQALASSRNALLLTVLERRRHWQRIFSATCCSAPPIVCVFCRRCARASATASTSARVVRRRALVFFFLGLLAAGLFSSDLESKGSSSIVRSRWQLWKNQCSLKCSAWRCTASSTRCKATSRSRSWCLALP